jgi:hypothetical protein
MLLFEILIFRMARSIGYRRDITGQVYADR